MARCARYRAAPRPLRRAPSNELSNSMSAQREYVRSGCAGCSFPPWERV
jgi:hypothetical protein